MNAKRVASVRRLLADLRRSDTRGDALSRIRRRAGSLLRGLRGLASDTASTPPKVANERQASSGLKHLARDRGRAALAESIAQGEPLERAVTRCVAALADATEWSDAWAIAEGAARLPGGAAASAMGHALLLHRRRQYERAWTRLRDVDDQTLATHIPLEAVDAALADGSAETRRRALAIAAPSEHTDASMLVDLAGRFLAFDERARAAELVAELRRRPTADLDDRRRDALTRIERWLDPRTATVPAGSIPVAVMGDRTPDHEAASGTLDDHIQGLALVANLARLSGVTFTGEEGLGDVAAELQGRVQPGLRRPDVDGAVHLVPVDRGFSSASDVPDGTWTVAYGDHVRPLFDLRYDFPYHPNIRPLFLSFHVERVEMLSPDALDYLRRFGPVGCRDWTTVFLLLSAGVDAFFSGCLTTTVDAIFPPRTDAYRGNGHVGLIDVPRKAAAGARNVREYRHAFAGRGSASLADGLRDASAVLAAYQQDLDRAVTGDLLAYLPLVALGVPVDVQTDSPGDARLAGLTGLRPGDPRLATMQTDIRDLITGTIERILAGADEREVYDRWRELTRDRVAAAKARFEAPVVDPPKTVDVAAAVAIARAGSRRSGPHDTVDPATVTNIVLCFDQNLTSQAPVLIESMLANASGPLRLWVLGRGLSRAYEDWLAGAFPSLPLTFVPCDAIAYHSAGRPRRLPARITISTLDRLILPELLDDIDRVVYVDIDTLVLGDICRLAATDLGGRPVAARDSNVSEASEWQRAPRRMEEEPATELRRRMGLHHGFGHAALNAGVLVLDLDRLRRDDFSRTYLPWVERYGLHDQDIMLAYAGPDRAVLEPRWNAMPVLEDVADPSLIHWASFGKPWDPELTYGRDLWQGYAAALHARAGVPPVVTEPRTPTVPRSPT